MWRINSIVVWWTWRKRIREIKNDGRKNGGDIAKKMISVSKYKVKRDNAMLVRQYLLSKFFDLSFAFIIRSDSKVVFPLLLLYFFSYCFQGFQNSMMWVYTHIIKKVLPPIAILPLSAAATPIPIDAFIIIIILSLSHSANQTFIL